MQTKNRRGFSLVELMMAIAVVAILISLLLPALQQTREASNRARCSNNLRVQSFALNEYHEDFGSYPPAVVVDPLTSFAYAREEAPVDGVFWSWAYRIAPYTGHQQFFDIVDPVDDFPFWSSFAKNEPTPGRAHISLDAKLYQCPSDPRFPIGNFVDGNNDNNQAALTSYLAVNGRNQFAEDQFGGQDGVIYVNSSVSIDEITDGTSNTLVIGERPPVSNGLWGWTWAGAGNSPGGVLFGTTDVVLGVHEATGASSFDHFRPGTLDDPSNLHRFHFWSFHKGGANWAFADGSTRFLTYDIDSAINESTQPGTPPTLLAQLATRAGGSP